MLIILTACGIQRTPLFLRGFCGYVKNARFLHEITMIFTIGLLGFSSLMYFPKLIAEYSDDYWGVSSDLKKQIEKGNLDQALIFVTSKYRNFSSANPPQKDSPIIYAINMDAKIDESKNYIPVFGKLEFNPHKNNLRNLVLMDYYPNRDVYIEKNGKLTKIR